jgi:hypothetical protein
VTQDRNQDGADLSAADEQLLRKPTRRARAGGLKLAGERGLLGRLTKMIIESALEGELEPSDLRLSADCQRPRSIVGLCSTSAAEHEPPPGHRYEGTVT